MDFTDFTFLAVVCLLSIIDFLIDVIDDDCISFCNFSLRVHNLRDIQLLSVALKIWAFFKDMVLCFLVCFAPSAY